MKKLIVFLLISCFCLSLAACGSEEESSATVGEFSMYDLSQNILASDNFNLLMHASNEDEDAETVFHKVSDLDYSKVAAFTIDASANGSASADEIVVIRLKDAADAAAAKESLNRHLESRKELYKTYAADLLPVLENAKTVAYREFAALFVCKDPAAANAFFEGYIDAH